MLQLQAVERWVGGGLPPSLPWQRAQREERAGRTIIMKSALSCQGACVRNKEGQGRGAPRGDPCACRHPLIPKKARRIERLRRSGAMRQQPH